MAKLLVAMIASLPVSYASAVDTLKVGYVNTQRLFRDAPAAVRAAKKIEQEFSKRDQDLQRLAKQLQSLQETLEKNALTMSESERRGKEKDLAELSRDFQRKQREFREDLNLRQNEENAAIIEKANKAIKQLADSEKYDLILQDVVWVSPKLDITDKVIKALSDAK
ncbi:MAG TPA: OmpH family outer membrane protein [Accumulibacter sp.]|nr:OmpH family outer membrane protein [Accumulibacter sp.]HMW16437.1 OmpH family outer membrane protein [Accumulibacter sp.]HMX21400.1 OmpH family outer membrane protein [Accumulibacter sp.]HMY07160.1 OmpH family outer membrane protein [Accumulibacter sp.]HNC16667.1 OmpH family outer membrane protein [Accumulibacter sp.]